jgi:transposase, IS5 family
MRPKKHKTTGSIDLFRARLDQIINMKHELVLLAGKIDWNWIDGDNVQNLSHFQDCRLPLN